MQLKLVLKKIRTNIRNLISPFNSVLNRIINNLKYLNYYQKILLKVKSKNPKTYYQIINDIFPVKEKYIERLAVGYNNIDDKIERNEKNNLPFEFKNMVVMNQSISCFIDKNSKNIINIGGGTGLFEEYSAKIYPDKNFIVNEFDLKCHKYFKEKNPNIKNVTYTANSYTELKSKYGKFDLAVSVEVIEHVDSYKDFLTELTSLSDKAIITTPNKMRSYFHLHKTTPDYYQHTREWTPGEFYWILKMFYKNVDLYGINGWESSDIFSIGLFSTCENIIAYCNN